MNSRFRFWEPNGRHHLVFRPHHYLMIVCMKILDKFGKMSGQSINADKSMVCFSPKTPTHQRDVENELFHMKVVENLDSYLGLPIPDGKKKSYAFKSIVNRTASRINSWSKRLLSSAGKEIFVKVVIQSIPTYAFSIFLAPNGVAWGIGFKDLHLFNVALLGRQVWRLIECKDTLCYKVLSAKYFPNGDIFHPKKIDKPSFTWQSIFKATWNVE
ncbi:non-ltr retroelement reverse transcriptase [Gossypium australe]|uniref:Non-ltr retroelement reverse transcriptase n=1 Tax=Gossypium australe TaxID=47621 RepID=A0A5B6WQX3_9ROSI|nr:non-ltr retroelement reverse transcriptase [Gossypium australe]